MKKYKSYSTYKSSGVEWLGNIPEHWGLRRIKSIIVNSINGAWGEDPKDDDNDVICVRVADFDYSSLGISSNSLTLRNIEPSQQLSRILLKTDLLIEKSGGGENQSVGRMVSFNLDKKSVCSNFIARLVISREVHHRFLCYVFAAMYSINLNIRSIKQTTGIQNLDLYSYLCETFAFPSFEEQDLIANFLDRETTRIDTLITKKGELINLLKKKRNTVIAHAVTKGLDPEVPMKDSGISWISQIPKHWLRIPTKYVCSSVRDGTHNPPPRVDGEYRLLSVRNIQDGEFILRDDDRLMDAEAFAELQRSYTVRKGDVVVAVVGATTGKSAVVGDLEKISVQRSIAILRPNYSMISSNYLNFWIGSSVVQYEIALVASKYAAQGGIYLEDLANLTCVVPPTIEEQTEILNFLDKAFIPLVKAEKKLLKQINELKKYRQALITAAVTGKIDVREEVERGAA
ncbi:MAG: restriction endonuclease subunit S [Limnoraphis sp.]